MKKILQIVSSPLQEDGLTRIALEIDARLKGSCQMELAARYEEGNPIAEAYVRNGGILYRLPEKKDLFSYMKRIRRIVAEGSYDAVYIHGNSAMMYFEARPAKRCKVPVLTHCHNTRTDHPLAHRLLKPSFNRLVDLKIGCSDPASFWAYCGDRIRTIRNGVDTERYRFRPEVRSRIRGELGIGDKVVFGFAGRFNKQKNVLFLLDIFSGIRKKEPDADLLLFGDGEMKEEIREKIRALALTDHVKEMGVTNELEDFYQAMDVMIMPSLYEGLSLVALEVQANGLPLLLSDACAKETFVTDYAVPMSLDKGADAWAEKALALYHELERGKATEEAFRSAGLTKDAMQDQIRECIGEAVRNGERED